MARNPKDSTKVFGGTSVPAGVYHIASAIITEETLTLPGQPESKYDCLQLVLKQDVNGTPGAEIEATLSLNGCWRARRGEDGNAYRATGSLYDLLLANCQGKSFNVTRDYINANCANKRIAISYTEYPSQSGGFGRVPVVNFV